MAQTDTYQADFAKLQAFPTQFAEMGKKQLEALAETQKQFWETAGKMNKAWLDQSQSEVALVSEFFNKLSSAKSLPDAQSIYQEFVGRQLQMIADGGRRMVDDCENLVKANTRLFSAGRNGNGGMSA